MEEYEDIIFVVRILKNKEKEDVEGECNFTEEVDEKLSETENITEQNTDNTAQQSDESRFQQELPLNIPHQTP